MYEVTVFYGLYPFWTWLAVGALLLAVEVATGSGYLLWPAASAGVVALLTLAHRLGLPIEALIFALLTIATTILARLYWPPRPRHPGDNINERGAGLVGRWGETVGAFASGQGRVFVDGVEWTAELAGAVQTPPQPGARVQVVEVVGGGRLRVRGAEN